MKASSAANERVLRENQKILERQLALNEAARVDGERIIEGLEDETKWAAGEIARLRDALKVASAIDTHNCVVTEEGVELINQARRGRSEP